MVDIDRFSEVNNSLGHEQGDLVLREAARILRESTRDVDSVCRYGGDEFSIIMPETDYQDALLKARRFCEQLRVRTFPNVIEPSNPVKITLSIGVTALRSAARSGADLLREADEAMYAAKNSGRDRVCGSLA
jgi:two-component system cell cycle response regulator